MDALRISSERFSDYVVNLPIGNLPPEFVTFDGNQTVNAGQTLSLSNVSFTDPGQEIVSAEINWGDGTTTRSSGHADQLEFPFRRLERFPAVIRLPIDLIPTW